MNIDELQTYIDEFLGWIDQDGVSVLKPDQLKLATYWREELKASQRMLEIKPELPIAFLGPSQQGKSSLINAILGENILAVGGAIGACTSVITSVHYSENERFLAEINFISLDDWRAELTAMNAALSNQLGWLRFSGQ